MQERKSGAQTTPTKIRTTFLKKFMPGRLGIKGETRRALALLAALDAWG